jgi:hypothetical protein
MRSRNRARPDASRRLFAESRALVPAAGIVVEPGWITSPDVLGFGAMELNQIKRFIKDLEERTDSLRRYL